ncbi:hypothetical protein E2542_SST01757 [Spatholobus suberectus]|nr:hypothetical protein E2542_SST01757 [Spatholobus suberectus]
MPSGAKKRKAAKKKKEKETEINTNPSTANYQGNYQLKSHEHEKGSDGGSPAHGDHDLAFNEEVEESGPSAGQPSDAASKDFLEEVPGDAKIGETEGGKEGGVVIEWDMKSEGSESKDVSVGHVESAKESSHGNGNSSSSNEETVTVKNSKDESLNSINETVAFNELVKFMDSLHAKMVSITQNVPVEETGDLVAESSADPVKAVAFVPEVQSIDNENALLEKSTESQVEATDLAVKKNEDKEYHFSDQNVITLSLEEPKFSDQNVRTLSSEEPKFSDQNVRTLRLEEPKFSDQNVGTLRLEEPKFSDQNVRTLSLEETKFSDQKARTLSLEEPKPQEFDNEVSASVSHSPIPESTIGAEHVKDSDTPECSENQPIVASAPHVVQKTSSWLSCCGLFEALLGSSR